MFKNIFPAAPVPRGKAQGSASRTSPEAPRPRRSRPPRSLRDKFTKSLPNPSGPYGVGSIDLELPVPRRDFGKGLRVGEDVLVAETVLFTLFYPIKLGEGEADAPDGGTTWSRQTWLNRDRMATARGYGDFGGVNKLFAEAFFLSTVGLTKLPAWRNAKLARHFPADGNLHDSGAGIKDRSFEPEDIDREPIFPLLLFSHGLGGTRTTYSAICTEWASYGWVCACVEHRDGSGPRTFINYAPDAGRKPRKVDYVEPYHGENDTANEVPTDRELRDAQIAMRKYELDQCYRAICRINAGDGAQLAEENRRHKAHRARRQLFGHRSAGAQSTTDAKTAGVRGRRKSTSSVAHDAASNVVESVVGGTSRGTVGVDWSSWKNRIQIDNVTMAGHSFGGATAYAVCRTPAMLSYVKQAVLLDTWGQGISPNPLADEQPHPGVPLLVIGSESFLFWDENTDIMYRLARDAVEKARQPCWLCTIRGSFHLSFSDYGVLWPHLFKLLFSTKVDAQRCIDIILNMSMEFFRQVMPPQVSRWNRAVDEHLLQTKVSDNWRQVEGDHNAWRKKMQAAAKARRKVEKEARKMREHEERSQPGAAAAKGEANSATSSEASWSKLRARLPHFGGAHGAAASSRRSGDSGDGKSTAEDNGVDCSAEQHRRSMDAAAGTAQMLTEDLNVSSGEIWMHVTPKSLDATNPAEVAAVREAHDPAPAPKKAAGAKEGEDEPAAIFGAKREAPASLQNDSSVVGGSKGPAAGDGPDKVIMPS